MAADALSCRLDYEKPPQKHVHFASQRGLPLCMLYYFDSSLVAGFIEVILGQSKGDQLGNTIQHTEVQLISTCSTEGSTSEVHAVFKALDSAAAMEKLSEGQTLQSLKDNADKPLVVFTRVENKDGCHVCSEQENHVGMTERLEGHHPSSTIGFLTTIVLEPGWIARVGSAY